MNIFDVAKYVAENVPNITAMKLQKLVYYCQSWSLAWDDEPLFEEDFQAWANGPVNYELYSIHRGLYKIEPDLFDHRLSEDDEFTQDQLETIQSVLEHYGDKSPHYLSELTHKENPWKETRKNTPLGESSNEVITKELMQEYYGGLVG